MKWMRRLLVLTILGLLVLYPLLAPPAHRIDQAHCDLIKAGMTRQQVEGILGVPAGDYDWAEADQPDVWAYTVLVRHLGRFRATQVFYEVIPDEGPWTARNVILDEANVETTPGRSMLLRLPMTQDSWTGRHGSFTVWFDGSGRVTSASHASDVKIVPPWQRWWRKYSGK